MKRLELVADNGVILDVSILSVENVQMSFSEVIHKSTETILFEIRDVFDLKEFFDALSFTHYEKQNTVIYQKQEVCIHSLRMVPEIENGEWVYHLSIFSSHGHELISVHCDEMKIIELQNFLLNPIIEKKNNELEHRIEQLKNRVDGLQNKQENIFVKFAKCIKGDK